MFVASFIEKIHESWILLIKENQSVGILPIYLIINYAEYIKSLSWKDFIVYENILFSRILLQLEKLFFINFSCNRSIS